MRPLYLNPQDELGVCLSMESLQEARTQARRKRQLRGKMERQTETVKAVDGVSE